MNDDIDFFILICLLNQPQEHSRYKKAFYKRLSYNQRKMRNRRVPRAGLLRPEVSAWRKVYESKNNQTFVTLTELDCASFHALVPQFEEHYTSTSPSPDANGKYVPIDPKRGRNRLLRPEDCLGLVLMWTRTRGSLSSTQLIFGISYTTCCDYLKFGTRILLKTLYNNPAAEVKVPSFEKIKTYMQAIESRHPSLKDVWCTMDGLKLSIECASGH